MTFTHRVTNRVYTLLTTDGITCEGFDDDGVIHMFTVSSVLMQAYPFDPLPTAKSFDRLSKSTILSILNKKTAKFSMRGT